jgi:hypothetical protein
LGQGTDFSEFLPGSTSPGDSEEGDSEEGGSDTSSSRSDAVLSSVSGVFSTHDSADNDNNATAPGDPTDHVPPFSFAPPQPGAEAAAARGFDYYSKWDKLEDEDEDEAEDDDAGHKC